MFRPMDVEDFKERFRKVIKKRLVSRGVVYPIWYENQRFVFKVSQYLYTADVYRIGLKVGVERANRKFYQFRIKWLREQGNLTLSTGSVRASSTGFSKEVAFWQLWPELEATLKNCLLSDIKAEKPFVINCSMEFPS